MSKLKFVTLLKLLRETFSMEKMQIPRGMLGQQMHTLEFIDALQIIIITLRWTSIPSRGE